MQFQGDFLILFPFFLLLFSFCLSLYSPSPLLLGLIVCKFQNSTHLNERGRKFLWYPSKLSRSRISRTYAVHSLQELTKERTQAEAAEQALKRATLCSEHSCQNLEVSPFCTSKALIFRLPQPGVHLVGRAISPGSLQNL